MAAGASASDLIPGDNEVTTGDQLVQRRQPAQAGTHFANAEASYSAAAQRARTAATQAAKPVEPPPTTTPAATPAAQPAVDPRPQIQTVLQGQLQAIAQAFAARDIKQLQAAWPGMSSQQSASFGEFFKNAKEITVSLTPGDITVNDDRGDVPVTETLHYRDGEGKHDSPPQSLRAHLLRQPNGSWRVISIQ